MGVVAAVSYSHTSFHFHTLSSRPSPHLRLSVCLEGGKKGPFPRRLVTMTITTPSLSPFLLLSLLPQWSTPSTRSPHLHFLIPHRLSSHPIYTPPSPIIPPFCFTLHLHVSSWILKRAKAEEVEWVEGTGGPSLIHSSSSQTPEGNEGGKRRGCRRWMEKLESAAKGGGRNPFLARRCYGDPIFPSTKQARKKGGPYAWKHRHTHTHPAARDSWRNGSCGAHICWNRGSGGHASGKGRWIRSHNTA